MRLSRGKINQLSQVLLAALLQDDRVEFYDDDNNIRLNMVHVFTEELTKDEDIDGKVRSVINSYSRRIREGTPEWDLLYQKHYREEERKKRGI